MCRWIVPAPSHKRMDNIESFLVALHTVSPVTAQRQARFQQFLIELILKRPSSAAKLT